MSSSPVLYAEDSDDDAVLMRRAFKKLGPLRPLVIVHNGREVVDYLSGSGFFTDRSSYPLPTLILLDVKMPLMNGLEVLEWINQQSNLRHIPVLMLSSSSQDTDIASAYSAGAKAFLLKPTGLSEFHGVVEDLIVRCNRPATPAEWLEVRGCLLPPKCFQFPFQPLVEPIRSPLANSAGNPTSPVRVSPAR